jgi:hypothetical protein
MANIIRIRALEQEKNLNDIIFPVDKNIYGSNAKRISIFDLKTWILSGFTGGGTSCTGITSNVIRIIVTGSTTTTTTTTSTSTTTTTTTTPAPTIPQIYFNPNGSGLLAINNPGGKTFTITFSYYITAACDNVGTDGQDPNQASTTFDISTNGGSTWSTIDSVTAVVSGGNFPNGQADSQQKTGTITLNNIPDVTNIKVGGGFNCDIGRNGQNGTITATIITVVPNIGIANIICNDTYDSNCSSTYISCTQTGTTTTTTTMVPYYTYNFNKTCSSVSGNFVFERIDIPQILVNTIVSASQPTPQSLVSGGQYRVTINLYGVTCPGANLTVNAYSNSTASDTGSIVYNFTVMPGIVYVINANVPNLIVTPATLFRYTTAHSPNLMCGLLPYQFPFIGEFTSQTIFVPGNLLPNQTYPNIYTNYSLSTKFYPGAQYDWGISITSGSPVSYVVTVQTDGTLNTWVACV